MSFKKVCDFEIPKDDQYEIRDILCQLVHASDESIYLSLKEDLFQIVCEDFRSIFSKIGILIRACGFPLNGIHFHIMETQQIIAWRAVTVSLTTFCHQSD